jgi:phosphoribosyl 1,2-cyclic phosphodiesterase
LAWNERLRPRRANLTHMSHELYFRALASRLPMGVAPGVDGMVIDLF